MRTRAIPPWAVGFLATVALLATGAPALAQKKTKILLRDAAFWTRADSASVRTSIGRDAEALLLLVREAWKSAERRRDEYEPTRGSPMLFRRRSDFHCHFDGSTDMGSRVRGNRRNDKLPPRTMIRSAFSRFAVCPAWLAAGDVPRGVDQSARPELVPDVAAAARIDSARRAVVVALDSAAARLPGNRWIAGQRVRFRHDAGDLAGATRVAAGCSNASWWCGALLGYALYREGDLPHADSAFALAEASMTPAEQCSWNDVEPLLSTAARLSYTTMGCAGQAAVNPVLWWLADPLWVEPGNDRRLEQLARRVRTILDAGFDLDAFHDLRLRRGGDAIAYMHLRFGWPTYLWWAGDLQERGHDEWLQGDFAPPYTAPEYSRDRIATFPFWEAVVDPFSVDDDDYELAPPDGVRHDEWWPWEHYRRARGPLVSIDGGQRALLRRDSSTLFVVATNLRAAALESRIGERVDAFLVLSRRPGHVQVMATQRQPLGERAVLRGMLDSGKAVMGVEFLARTPAAPDGRSRFGVTVPPPLHLMARGSTALSDPLLFQVPDADVGMPDDAEFAIEQMLPSLQLRDPGKVGIFWESYGFRAGDTVSVSIRLQRITSVGKLRRLGMALRLASDPNSSITIGWREPEPGRRSRVVPALVPTLARSVSIDLSPLVSGAYRLEVAVARPGQAPVTSARTVTIQRTSD